MQRIFLAALAGALLVSTAFAQEDAPAPPPVNGDGSSIIVPGERPGPTPPADPRTTRQRMRDIRAWDRCVMQVQRAADDDPLRPQFETPEEHCSQSLGMADRLSVPISRQLAR
ncbi:MAG: hypothetical protein GC189_08075 [Alphaproteobacteria bacterium]|nr:hypothetical protein [Alphaproteobacteria bacterium]